MTETAEVQQPPVVVKCQVAERPPCPIDGIEHTPVRDGKMYKCGDCGLQL